MSVVRTRICMYIYIYNSGANGVEERVWSGFSMGMNRDGIQPRAQWKN